MTPKVSFIVPCFNYAHYLRDCVDSILAQTFGDFEIIIMDDCSPDATPEVARSFEDSRVSHVRQQVNLGSGANINDGIKRSQGEYLWVMSADDRLSRPDALARYVAMAESHPRTGFVFSPALRLLDGKTADVLGWSKPADHDRVFPSSEFYARMAVENVVAAASVMMRKACWEVAGPWPREPRLCPDWHLWCRFALRYDVAYLADPLACYRHHPASMWHTFLREKQLIVIEHPQRMRWMLLELARQLGDTQKAEDTIRGIIHHYVLCMNGQYATLSPAGEKSDTLNMTAQEFEQSLDGLCPEPGLRRRIREGVRVGLADSFGQMGRRHQATGDIERARHYYREAIRLNPLKMKTMLRWAHLRLWR